MKCDCLQRLLDELQRRWTNTNRREVDWFDIVAATRAALQPAASEPQQLTDIHGVLAGKPQRMVDCGHCNGTGQAAKNITCQVCLGAGEYLLTPATPTAEAGSERGLQEAVLWATVTAKRALIADFGRDVIVCDRLPSPVTLILGFTVSQLGNAIEALKVASSEQTANLAARVSELEAMDREAGEYVESQIALRTSFTGEPPYVGWKGLGLALKESLDERDALRSQLTTLQAENEGLRREVAESHQTAVALERLQDTNRCNLDEWSRIVTAWQEAQTRDAAQIATLAADLAAARAAGERGEAELRIARAAVKRDKPIAEWWLEHGVTVRMALETIKGPSAAYEALRSLPAAKGAT